MSDLSSAASQSASVTLPPGWMMAIGEQLFQVVRGVTYNKTEASDSAETGKIPILRAGNIQDSRLNHDGLVYVPDSCVSTQQKLLAGDLVVAMSSGSKSIVGKVGFVDHIEFPISFGAFCAAIRPLSGENSDWLRWYFRTPAYRGYISEKSAGVNINNLKPSHLLELNIPLPPLPEQRRIVALLEALEARSRRAREKLAEVPTQLAKARQSLLATALCGDLTADWRNQNPGPGWVNGQLKDLVQIRYGKGMPVSDLLETGYPVFGANGVIGFTDTFHFEQPQVLISCRGAYSGKINWSPPRCFVTNNSLSVVPLNPEQLFQHWLYYALCGSDTSQMVTGTAQPQVTIANAETLEISVPPLIEQHEIVRRLSAAFARLDTAVSAHAAAVSAIDRLDQSLLARAFSGEMVPQSPNDEPASITLERFANAQFELPKVKRERRPREAAFIEPVTQSPMPKSRLDSDVKGQPYLANLLRKISKERTVEELLKRSDLPLVDFYKQLDWEVRNGKILNDSKKLEPVE